MVQRSRQGRRAIDRRCRAMVEQLDDSVGIPAPFELEVFLRGFCATRGGRPITLMPLPLDELPVGTCGLWLRLANHDVIGFPAGISSHHRDHIVLHEVGHMVAGHGAGGDTGGGQDGELTATLLPDLDPAMVRAVLGRSAYDAVEEHEAELTASLILQRSLQPTGARTMMNDAMRRMVRLFGGTES